MPYIMLTAATVFISFSGIGATFYNRRNRLRKDGAPLYNLIVLSVVFLAWLVRFLTNPAFEITVIPYALIFTVGYTTAMASSVFAYREGPMMLSSLIMQLSLISTTVWGFFFWESEVTPRIIVGLILVIFALVLCLYNGGGAGEKKVNLRWLFFISLFFVGNSVGAITQRTQQIDFDSRYGDFFMVIATAISLAVCVVVYWKSDRSDTKAIMATSWYLPALSGLFNFFQNLFVIALATLLSSNIVYPVLMIGSLSITLVFSIGIFREKMKWWQWIGVLLGAVAIALLC